MSEGLPDTDPNKYPITTGIYRLPIAYLRKEHKYNENMQIAINELESHGFTHWRKARGDGNCYFRSVAVSHIEFLIRN